MELFNRIILSGAVVNFFVIIFGAMAGFFFKKGLPEKVTNAIMTGLALIVLLIGISGAVNEKNNYIIIILSVVLGTVFGTLLDLDGLINKAAAKLESTFKKSGDSPNVAEGFVAATLLFCVGAMTIVGSLESGISGNNATLYSKSLIDGISAAVLTSTLGIGVGLSAFPVLIIEGGLTLLATVISPILTESMIVGISTVGSLLIIALSFNMLKLTKIKIMNLLPSVFMPIILCLIIK